LKHTINIEELFGSINIGFDLDYGLSVIIGHPEWNLIFFVGDDGTIIAYDMDRRKGLVTPTTVYRYSRNQHKSDFVYRKYYLPYVPLFLDSLY